MIIWAYDFVTTYQGKVVNSNGEELSATDQPPSSLSQQEIFLCWTSPPLGSIKANFDATFDVAKGCCGLGMIVRNNRGEVLASTFWFLDGGFSFEIAEVLALRSAGLKSGVRKNRLRTRVGSESGVRVFRQGLVRVMIRVQGLGCVRNGSSRSMV
ncbi:hypothetical protein F8388_001197 [Cannabis sativa]|uniref:RNase H type-1 domain-containing protein n=1 Tax=Cannabis sativa TaxID=3483 RepID=A0A7J6G235_CANSA|nr:hypothetical protein F8388_001197 [Cannabis sativa]KAF4377061.1 hypothetical protein G4B88_023847 [Cannabis sativa]